MYPIKQQFSCLTPCRTAKIVRTGVTVVLIPSIPHECTRNWTKQVNQTTGMKASECPMLGVLTFRETSKKNSRMPTLLHRNSHQDKR
jgi:hypothetical protein